MHQVHVSDNVSALLLNGVRMFTRSSREQNMFTGNVIVVEFMGWSALQVGATVKISHHEEYKKYKQDFNANWKNILNSPSNSESQ